MSDYIQSGGYFGYYPFENIRERKQGILISQLQYPLDLDQLASNKLDFAYIRLGYNATDTFTLDTQATASNLIALANKGLSIGLYCYISPWTHSTAWDTTIGTLNGVVFASYLNDLRKSLTQMNLELVPMINISDSGSMTTISSTTFKNYLNAFYDGYNSTLVHYGSVVENRLIIRTDYATTTKITGTLSLNGDYPLLCLDKAYVEEYASATTSTTYPSTAFTVFGGYTTQAIHITYSGTGLNSKYGIGSSSTVLFLVNDDYTSDIYLSELSVPEDINLYILDEKFINRGVLCGKSFEPQSSYIANRTLNIDGLDIISGNVYSSDYTKYVAVGNYLLTYDFDLRPQIYEITEVNINSDIIEFNAENIIRCINTDIITSETVGMTAKTISEHISDALTGSTNDLYEVGDVIGIFDSEEKVIELEYNNIFEEDLETGFLNASTGAEEVNASYTRNEDYFYINRQNVGYYYINKTTISQAYLYYWNDKDEFISRIDLGTTGVKSFTMPWNAKKGRIVVNNANTTQEIVLTDSNFMGITVKEFIDKVCKTFDCYTKSRLVIEENNLLSSYFVDNYYLDIYKNIGNSDNGLIYSDGANVGDANYNEREEELFTAIIPKSDSVSYSSWLSYSRSDAPYYKVAGTPYMFNSTTIASYGKIGKHRVTTSDFSQVTNLADLFNEGKKYLESTTKPKSELTFQTAFSVPRLLNYPKVGDNKSIILTSFKLKKYDSITKIRYIRNKVNGSNVNTTAVFNEIRAYSLSGSNVAYGATVTAEEYLGGTWNSVATPALTNPSGGTFGIVTDSNPATWCIPTYNATPQRVIVDLGSLQEITDIKITHYYADNRAFKENVTEVSADGTTWYTLYDSDVDGEYPETGDLTYTVSSLIPTTDTTEALEIYPDDIGQDISMEKVDDSHFLLVRTHTNSCKVLYIEYSDGYLSILDEYSVATTSSNPNPKIIKISNNRYMVMLCRYSGTDRTESHVLAIESGSIVSKANVQINTNATFGILLSKISDNVVLATYQRTSSNNVRYATCIKYDGTSTITFGTEVQILATSCYFGGINMELYDTNKVMHVSLSTAVYRPTYVLLSVNTSTLAVTVDKTETTITTNAGYGAGLIKLATNKLLLMYTRTSGVIVARVLTISGTTVSVGSEQTSVDIGTPSVSVLADCRCHWIDESSMVFGYATTMCGANNLITYSVTSAGVITHIDTNDYRYSGKTSGTWSRATQPDFLGLTDELTITSELDDAIAGDYSMFIGGKSWESISTTYDNMLLLNIPYYLIQNEDGFIYDDSAKTLIISEIEYSLNYPKEVNVKFGELQRDITDSI